MTALYTRTGSAPAERTRRNVGLRAHLHTASVKSTNGRLASHEFACRFPAVLCRVFSGPLRGNAPPAERAIPARCRQHIALRYNSRVSIRTLSCPRAGIVLPVPSPAASAPRRLPPTETLQGRSCGFPRPQPFSHDRLALPLEGIQFVDLALQVAGAPLALSPAIYED